jgi:hypothetical protein
VLSEISAFQGPMDFALLDRVRLVSSDERTANAYSSLSHIHQRVTATASSVLADVGIGVIGPGAPRIETRVNLRPGQYMVLAQGGYEGDSPFGARKSAPESDLTLLYVVRAEILSSDG